VIDVAKDAVNGAPTFRSWQREASVEGLRRGASNAHDITLTVGGTGVSRPVGLRA
jgi:hypothetical protein